MIFIEVTIFLVTIVIALYRIFKTLHAIPELRANKMLLCVHFWLVLLLSLSLLFEYFEYFG